MTPQTKPLILELLLAAEHGVLSAREAILACGLFGLQENNVRVTLARLCAEGMLETAERGLYRLGPQASELAGDVATWRNVETRLRPWHGDYLLVHVGSLGRTDRTALRRRERALRLLGFRELERGLFIRPNNIESGIEAVRLRLYRLGLEETATVFQASGFDGAREQLIRELWDGTALTEAYTQTQRRLEDGLRTGPHQPPAVAACEAFVLGSQAIRQVVYDPLLPSPFVDAERRHHFITTVKTFDAVGHRIWTQVLAAPSTRLTGDAA